MKEKLLKIINCYGVLPQLKYFQSENYEFLEAVLQYESINNYDLTESNFKQYGNKQMIEHIAGEIADCYVMLEQFRLHYDISTEQIREIMKNKIDRQIERIEKESSNM